MAKRKKAASPDAVFDRVRLSRVPGVVWPVVPESELDAAEAELGVPLPASYRTFATRFGLAGEFWGLWRLPPVIYTSKKLEHYGVINWTRWMQENIVEEYGANMSLPKKQLRRFVFFGDDCGGGNFAWDTGNPVSKKPVEYPVYWYPRTDRRIQHWGDSFAEFVQRVHTESRQFDDWHDEFIEWVPNRVRKRKKPLKRDVKVWLAANSHTARDLALAIRNDGHTDAFPVLADALQEAGCTNADLLDSCRAGEPDIDGAWVLQVLLGKDDRPRA